jgi:hypothetical protein
VEGALDNHWTHAPGEDKEMAPLERLWMRRSLILDTDRHAAWLALRLHHPSPPGLDGPLLRFNADPPAFIVGGHEDCRTMLRSRFPARSLSPALSPFPR